MNTSSRLEIVVTLHGLGLQLRQEVGGLGSRRPETSYSSYYEHDTKNIAALVSRALLKFPLFEVSLVRKILTIVYLCMLEELR